jgi:hypothetical protein
MKLEVTVSEIADIFKEIQERPGQLFEMIRLDIREVVGKYLTAMMNAELTHFLGREPYVRVAEDVDHLDLAEVGLLKQLQDLQVVTLDEEILGGVEINGFLAAGRQGGDAGLLDDLETVGLARPVHPVAFLSRVSHFPQGQLEPLKIDLRPLGKDLRKEFLQLLPLLINDLR